MVYYRIFKAKRGKKREREREKKKKKKTGLKSTVESRFHPANPKITRS